MADAPAPRTRPWPRCATCRHWRAHGPYPHCLVVNVREGWGDLTHMPAEAHDGCHRHEDDADA